MLDFDPIELDGGRSSELAEELSRQLASQQFFNVLKDAVRAVRAEEKREEEEEKRKKENGKAVVVEDDEEGPENGPLKGGKSKAGDDTDRLPANFTMPQFTLYKGNSNPAVHVSNYENLMRMKGTTDRQLAKMFPLTLADDPADWLNE